MLSPSNKKTVFQTVQSPRERARTLFVVSQMIVLRGLRGVSDLEIAFRWWAVANRPSLNHVTDNLRQLSKDYRSAIRVPRPLHPYEAAIVT